MGRYGVGLAIALLLAGTPWCVPLARAVAQDVPAVTEGARVRAVLRAPGGRYTGTVAGLRSDTLLLLPDGGTESAPLAISTIRQLHVSLGPASTARGAFHGARSGFAGGALAGMVAAAANGCLGAAFTYDWSSKSNECTDGEGTTVVALAIAGPIVGAVIGAARPGERWVSVPPQRLRATITSRGVGLAIPF